ncbi:MAG: hypothetical protein CVV44_08960 [Spirochaetae bacterium HGW-Spirochaetae-1]|nr:MAG: hypothetical protein CVV44_08960 [Spirochaetae bacterium HGW-Spirochaetae-1]
MKYSMKKCLRNDFSKILFLLLFLAPLICIFSTRSSLRASGVKTFALTQDRGVLISENRGQSWKEFNDGLPSQCIPLRIHASGKILYLITGNTGIFRHQEGTMVWESMNSDNFLIRSQYGTPKGYRKISAFSVDPDNAANIIMATKHTVYRSKDGGKHWSRISAHGLHERNYITALAIRGDTIYAGTSFNGFFQLNGGRFVRINTGLPQEPYSGTLFFTEELITLLPTPDKIYAGFRFGGGLYTKKPTGKAWGNINLPKFKDRFASVSDIGLLNNTVYVTSEKALWQKKEGDENWQELPLQDIFGKAPDNARTLSLYIHDTSGSMPSLHCPMEPPSLGKHDSRAQSRRTIYSSVPVVGKKLKNLMKIMHASNINAIVIDMKDDFGNIHYPTALTTPKDIGAARRPLPVGSIIADLKKAGIYTIARIVVFKDEKLFRGYGSKYAIYNKNTGRPWRGSPGEYWVDPHASFVQDYNIAIALELEHLGFDEIQFDYIRFPSDGPTWLCQFRHKKDADMYKSEILTEFLQRAKKKLSIPVSVDIYGFNSWYSFGNWIGQDMEEFSLIVDAICPMVYPSHFGSRFYSRVAREERTYSIIYDGGRRAQKIISSPVVIRPYLQAFNMMSPTWGPGYIMSQVKGAYDSGCSGYTFWNARGDYDMVERALGSALAAGQVIP